MDSSGDTEAAAGEGHAGEAGTAPAAAGSVL